MADKLTHPNPTSFDQGNNIPCTSPTHIPKFGDSSQPSLGQPYKISCDQIWAIFPIPCKFVRAIGLIPKLHNLLHFPKKNLTTPIGIVVSTVEDLVLATLEELEKTVEITEKPE